MTRGTSAASGLDHLTALLGGATWLDLSPVIRTDMPRWPTHPDVEIQSSRTHEEHGYFAQTLVLPEHSGCHVDAPAHLRSAGATTTIDEFALDALAGPAVKYDLTAEELKPGEALSYQRFSEIAAARDLHAQAGDIVLFEFGWDEHYRREESGDADAAGWWGANAPGLDEGICRSLAEAGVRAVGSDTAGCDIAERDGEILSSPGHTTWFLPRGIPIIEGLANLAAVPSRFFFLALPLKVDGGSGSPLRAVGLLPR